MEIESATKARALRFVVLVGVMSFFADFTYEGSRGILGPYLGLLGASGTIVGVVTGFGELAGYGLRLVSGRLADRTRQFCPITIFGYIVQMAAVPALALAHSWSAAAILLIMERVGKAIRNPPRDVMLSHAGTQIGGIGWAFGLHEALDQFGALGGPLLVAVVLAKHGDYRIAFAVLAIPAIIMLSLLAVARLLYPEPEGTEAHVSEPNEGKIPRRFWIYLTGSAFVGAAFVDYPLVAFHLHKANTVSATWVPVFLCRGHGRERGGFPSFRASLRPARDRDFDPTHTAVGARSPSRFPGKLLASTLGSCGLGIDDGSARVDHAGGRGADGGTRKTGIGLWAVYGWLRNFLVSGERAHRDPLRYFPSRDDFCVCCSCSCRDPLLSNRPPVRVSRTLSGVIRCLSSQSGFSPSVSETHLDCRGVQRKLRYATRPHGATMPSCSYQA
jgi:MFS family permease